MDGLHVLNGTTLPRLEQDQVRQISRSVEKMASSIERLAERLEAVADRQDKAIGDLRVSMESLRTLPIVFKHIEATSERTNHLFFGLFLFLAVISGASFYLSVGGLGEIRTQPDPLSEQQVAQP